MEFSNLLSHQTLANLSAVQIILNTSLAAPHKVESLQVGVTEGLGSLKDYDWFNNYDGFMGKVPLIQLAVNYVFIYPVIATIFVLEFLFRLVVAIFMVFPLLDVDAGSEDFNEIGN